MRTSSCFCVGVLYHTVMHGFLNHCGTLLAMLALLHTMLHSKNIARRCWWTADSAMGVSGQVGIPLDMCVPEAVSEHRPPALEHTPSTYLHAVTCNIILVYLDWTWEAKIINDVEIQLIAKPKFRGWQNWIISIYLFIEIEIPNSN